LRGQGSVEYLLVLGLILLVAVGAVLLLGGQIGSQQQSRAQVEADKTACQTGKGVYPFNGVALVGYDKLFDGDPLKAPASVTWQQTKLEQKTSITGSPSDLPPLEAGKVEEVCKVGGKELRLDLRDRFQPAAWLQSSSGWVRYAVKVPSTITILTPSAEAWRRLEGSIKCDNTDTAKIGSSGLNDFYDMKFAVTGSVSDFSKVVSAKLILTSREISSGASTIDELRKISESDTVFGQVGTVPTAGTVITNIPAADTAAYKAVEITLTTADITPIGSETNTAYRIKRSGDSTAIWNYCTKIATSANQPKLVIEIAL
jgi:hypothetical protein